MTTRPTVRICRKTPIIGQFGGPKLKSATRWPQYFSASLKGLCSSYRIMITDRYTALFGRDSGLWNMPTLKILNPKNF